MSLIGNQIRRIVGSNARSTEAAKAPRVARGNHDASVVAICARKGGVGKTTTAVNLAAGAALFQGQKVLLIDMDSQGHCASALHAVLTGVATDSLSGVLLGKRRDVQEIALATSIDGLHVTPSDKELGATEGVMAGRIGKEFLLRGALKVARTHYDLIIIDCPPNLGALTVNALMAADHALVCCDMAVLALEGVDDIFETLETLSETLGHDVDILGILRTRLDGRNVLVNDQIDAALTGRYGDFMLDTAIPVNTALPQAQAAGQPIYSHKPRSTGAAAYEALVAEVAPRLGM